MADQGEEYNYYEHLIPKEVLLDVFSFTTGIELSRFVKIHPYFKNLIQNFTKSLPSMTIKQLELTMDQERILMRNDDKTEMEFLDIHHFVRFIDEHPMSIDVLICWNSIWISKFMLTLAENLPIREVQLRHNEQTQNVMFFGNGRMWFSGRIHEYQPIDVNVLMDDYVKFKNTTGTNVNPHRLVSREMAQSFHFQAPNNFECAAIHFDNTANDDMFYHGEIVDWAVQHNYQVPPDGAGRVLILNYYILELPVASVVHNILEEIRQKPTSVGPFTLLFKHVNQRFLGSGTNNTIVVEPTPGMQFLAGKLHYDEELNTHSLVDANGEVTDGPVPARLEGEAQFAYIVRYKKVDVEPEQKEEQQPEAAEINEPGPSKAEASTSD